MRLPYLAMTVALALGAPACRRFTTTTAPRAEREAAAAGSADGGGLHAVPRDQLCVTSGIVASGSAPWRVRSSTMRAVLAAKAARDAAELRFRYLGPSLETAPFASGEVRRQVGVKLRALDTCNVLYAMWYLDAGGEVHASLKHNAGMSRHEQCGDRGYVGLRPTFSKPLPEVRIGERHSMSAEIVGTDLVVFVDGARVWQATLPPETFTFDGPAGVRSDNADLDIELATPNAAAGAEAARSVCP